MTKKVLRIFFMAFTCFIVACNNGSKREKQVKEETKYPLELMDLQQQVQQHPDSTGLRLQLAFAFDSIGAFKEALIQMDSLVKKDSTNYGLWFSKAQILQDKGDTANAIETYAKAIKIYPAPDALLSLANLYAEQKNARSLLICKQLKNMGLGREYDAHCAFIAGVYNARTGMREQAVKLFDECISNNYTYMEAYIEKGLLYFDEQQYKEALQVFQFASQVNNLYADAYYWIARCYEMMQQNDSAAVYFKQSLSLDKTSAEATTGLQRVSAK